MENWVTFFDWASKGILGGICLYGVNILSQMKNAIESLNRKMAIMVERTDWHSKEIDKIEIRLVRLENRSRSKNAFDS